ncbi:acyl-acyl carrier protein thioesterase TE3, chloroplastic-like isoform X1 [Amaranthus tricolor]|uniref:acyl-acyl carrier protein thioesterase TE3, chloroplastic-like isoform X1 n=1 Tax=Amaranthus tricolor TaxID=29722 RepID=UPI00258AF9A4|nr:acyl-acyl carrier protein thioesterase TE3, chloroplastic-like isoform X1 [Amaranthus tricolor]
MVLLQVLSTFTPTNVVSSPKTTPFPIRRPYLTNPLSLCHPSCYVISNPSPLLSSTPRRFSTLPSHANKFSCVNDRITGVLEMELKVRDYELDQYGVVNNAVYSSYCQLATHELGRVIGLNDDVIQNTGAAALSKFSITFLSPLKSGDEFVVKSIISDVLAARLFFDHFIYKLPNYEPIVEAKAVIVLLDKNHRPARIPEHVKSKAKQFMSNESSTMDLTKSFATI